MANRVRTRTVHFFGEVWRVRWMLVAAVGIVTIRAYSLLPEDSTTLKTLYRPAIGAMGFIAAHIGYQQAFPYINGRDLLFRALAVEEFSDGQSPDDRKAAAVTFAGACLLRGLIYAGFIIGAMLAV